MSPPNTAEPKFLELLRRSWRYKPQAVLALILLGMCSCASPRLPNDLRDSLENLKRDQGLSIAKIYGGRLEIVGFDGSRTQQSIGDSTTFQWGTVSGNGKLLAGFGGQMFSVADVNGKILWSVPGIAQELEVSPDGNKLAYVRPGYTGLCIIEKSDPKPNCISDHGFDPSWSSDSKSILFQDRGRIVIFNKETKESKTIANGEVPTWSPDQKWIAYRGPDRNYYLYDVSRKTSRPLFNGERILSQLMWSPNSEFLAFVTMYSDIHEWSDLSLTNVGADPQDVVVYRINDKKKGTIAKLSKAEPSDIHWVLLKSTYP